MRHRLELGKEFMIDYSHATHAKFASIFERKEESNV